MTSSRPPKRIELLLEGLGANDSFRNDLIGDLAEEFAARASRDGERRARYWYCREAARATPHLLYGWARALRRGDVGRLMGTAGFAYVMTVMLAGFFLLTVQGVMALAGLASSAFVSMFTGHSSSSLALRLLLTAPGSIIGGLIAARSDRRSPVGAALVLSILWASMSVIGPAIVGIPARMQLVPTWFRVVTPIVVIASVLTGAMFSLRKPFADSRNTLPET